jgi:hypothetical protein
MQSGFSLAHLAADVLFYIFSILADHHRFQLRNEQALIVLFQLLNIIAVHKLNIIRVVLPYAFSGSAIGILYGNPIIRQC